MYLNHAQVKIHEDLHLISLNSQVKKTVIMGNHLQEVLYEGEGTLCTSYGHLGYTQHHCSSKVHAKKDSTLIMPSSKANPNHKNKEEPWKMVIFPKRHPKSKASTSRPNSFSKRGIQVQTYVKAYDASKSKLQNTVTSPTPNNRK